MANVPPIAHHRSNRLLAALEPDDFALLEPNLKIVALQRGQLIYDTGDIVRHAYFPHDAMVSLVNVMEDGDLVEVAVFGREAVVGLVSALIRRKAFGRYVVQLPGMASLISLEQLNEVRDTSPSLRRLIRHFSEAFLLQTFQTVACNAVHGVEARCCRWILSTHDRSDNDTLPLTHEFLSEMLGVQRSSVSVVLRTLQTARLIHQHRGGITVADRAGLEEVACECYGKIRQNFEELLPGTYAPKGSSTH